MKKYILLAVASIFLVQMNAQMFSAPSQGYFSPDGDVKVLTVDSSEMTMKFDTSSIDDDIPSTFFLIKENGEQIEFDPTEILRIEIPRGEIPEDEVEIEELDDDEEYEDYNVIDYSEKTKTIIYEQVEVTHDIGDAFKKKYREDSYLLQLASVGMGDRLKIYICPNFEEGTEVAPMGEEVEELSRNREDYDIYEKYYFVKVGAEPAFRISDEEFIAMTPAIFGDCKPFRRKYAVKRGLDKELTQKRGKTSRKEVGSKRKKASQMRYPELAKLVVEYHELYEVMLVEQEKKRAEREAKKKKRN
ncbi:hypothetical protein N9B82_03375 [Saprospiraceae bacterium]|nr:hypothetical protein [Saprospiraceae bacterium]